MRAILYAILIGTGIAAAPAARAQGADDEQRVLEAIRSGRLKVTDEMIDAQRKLRPELRGRSNQEIREELEKRARGGAAQPAPAADSAEAPAVPGLPGQAPNPA